MEPNQSLNYLSKCVLTKENRISYQIQEIHCTWFCMEVQISKDGTKIRATIFVAILVVEYMNWPASCSCGQYGSSAGQPQMLDCLVELTPNWIFDHVHHQLGCWQTLSSSSSSWNRQACRHSALHRLSALAWYGSCYLEIQALSLPKKMWQSKTDYRLHRWKLNNECNNWMHTALTQCCQTLKQLPIRIPQFCYLLGLVLPLFFFEVDALFGDPMRRIGILKSSESLKMQCSACWSTMPSECLCVQGPFLLVKKQGTFSQPLASKIWTSKE